MIKKFSKKQSVRNAQYAKKRKEYLAVNNICEAKIECNGDDAVDVHHRAGRVGENMFNDFIAVCRRCHNWIEQYPLDAKRLGFSKNKIT